MSADGTAVVVVQQPAATRVVQLQQSPPRVVALRQAGPPGPEGPPGPPGQAGAGTIPMVAGAAVSGHLVLMPDGSGGVVPADPSAAAYQFVGISANAAAQGTPVQVAVDGSLLTEPSWSWGPGASVYVGAGGLLTASPLLLGVFQQVAVALSATTILVQPLLPITRS